MNLPTGPLFRPEVAEARNQRVYGDIILSNPLRTQATVFLICALVVLLSIWVACGSYTRSEMARGILITDRTTSKVIAYRAGLLTELVVREGDLVRPGQKIATVTVEQRTEGGVSSVGESLAALRAQQALTAEQVQFAVGRAASERRRVAATLAGLRLQRDDLADQVKLQKETVALTDNLAQRIEGVVEQGFVSRSEIDRRRQTLISARQDLARLQQQISAISAQEAMAAAEFSRLDAEGGTEVTNARISAKTLTQRASELESARAYSLEAAIGGRVTAVQAAAGRQVEPTIPLLEIVPENSALHAEVYAPTRAVGFIKPGQEVRLLYDAFPYQRFGSFRGRVLRISRTALDPRQLSAPLKIDEPVYRIDIQLESQSVAAFSERMSLQPGMTLTANLVLDRQSFLSWLLEPLSAVMNRNR